MHRIMCARAGCLLLCISPLVFAADLRTQLAELVAKGRTAGIVAGTIDANGRRHVIACGKLSKDRPDEAGGDTIFEVGSITKVFTSLVLADMVERGEVKLDDPVSKFLPEHVKVPGRDGRRITLLDLSMQVSGLPRMPNNILPKDPANPYADYGPQRLYQYLSSYILPRLPGEKYDYSNVGVGLLGHALALRAGMSYEEMVRRRVFDPLGMKSTCVTLSPEQKKRLAAGHDGKLNPVKNWDFNALAGAGAIRSTVNDMLRFLAANLELTGTPLKPAMRRMRAMRRETGLPGTDIAMAWHIRNGVWWHNGATAGYHSFAGFDPVAKKALVVLSNSVLPVEDVAFGEFTVR